MTSSDNVSLGNLPGQLANALGIPLIAGDILAAVILMSIVIVPILFFTRGKNPMLAFIAGFMMLAFGTAMSWIPSWIFILMILLTAALLSGIFRDWLSGRSGTGER